MIAHGNSFGLDAYGDSGSVAIQNPESAERLGDPLTWGWAGFQKAGNAL